MHLNQRQRSGRYNQYRVILLIAVLFISRPAMAQDETTVGDTVASPLSNTLKVRSGVGKSPLFGFSRNVLKPKSVPLDALVRAISTPDGEPRGRGGEVALLPVGFDVEATTNSEAVPPQTAPSQSEIARAARKYQFGVRAGVALDPELILLGVQLQLGPIFNSNVFFRPSVEFAYGEVTAMFGFNGEVIYRLSGDLPADRWSIYLGGGLGVNLLHQNFEAEEGGKRIDFGDFHSDSALNILGGVQNRSGLFMELRTSIYSEPSPTLRLVVGYSF